MTVMNVAKHFAVHRLLWDSRKTLTCQLYQPATTTIQLRSDQQAAIQVQNGGSIATAKVLTARGGCSTQPCLPLSATAHSTLAAASMWHLADTQERRPTYPCLCCWYP